MSEERAPYRVPGLTRGFPKDTPLRDRLDLVSIIKRRIEEYRAAHGTEPRFVVMDPHAYVVLCLVMGRQAEERAVASIHGLTIVVAPVAQMLVVAGDPWDEALPAKF